MRRVILNKGEQFSNKHLKRTGAFNARAMEAATNIIEQVREQGDAALRELHRALRRRGHRGLPRAGSRPSTPPRRRSIPRPRRRSRRPPSQIREFHERQVKQSWFSVREDGALVGAKVTPLESVGIYVPGGRALYPSTVLMNALPAAVAGVERIVCVTPPTKDGTHRPGGARGLPPGGRHRDLHGGRRAGRGGAGLRHRDHRAGRQDHRARATRSWPRRRRSSRATWAST